MFYVADGKIYSTNFDEKMGIYREVRMIVNADGSVVMRPQMTGSKSKPKNRQICTLDEIIAQFGGAATMVQPIEDIPQQEEKSK